MAELTDVSAEIAAMLRSLKEYQPPASGPAYGALAQLFDLPSGSPELFEVMSAMSDRLQSLRVFASAVQDDSMRDDLRQNIVRVVKSVSRMFEPQHLVQDWLHAQKQWLQEPDIVTLHWFSVIARQHRPLAKLDAGTRNLILSHIVDAQEDLRLEPHPIRLGRKHRSLRPRGSYGIRPV